MFCGNCGKEMPDSIKFCPYCGTKLNNNLHNLSMHPANDNKDSKNKFYGKVALIIAGIFEIIIIMFILFKVLSYDESSVYSNNLEVIDTISDIENYQAWKDGGFQAPALIEFRVKFPVENTKTNNYLVECGGYIPDLIVVMQEDEAPVGEWDWMLEAEPYSDTDYAYFHALVNYVGRTGQNDKYPVLVIREVEQAYAY